MISLANRRSVMTLFSGRSDIYSHQVRMVLSEKNVEVDIVDVDVSNKPEDLIDLNPYDTLPTLVDRDLVLYQSDIINEYLDERFPHPPLLPVYPVARAKSRLLLYRMKQDWFSLYDIIVADDDSVNVQRARKELTDSLCSVARVFAEKPFFMSEEISLVDCFVAPLLWRLPQLEISLPPAAVAIEDYADRIFGRKEFQQCLTEAEREMR